MDLPAIIFQTPVTNTVEEKLTASFYFKPLNLVIATGEYISTLRKDELQAAISTVSSTAYGQNGYFWIQDKDGSILAHPKASIVGTALSTTTKIANSMKGKSEAFVKIAYENPTTKKTENKITYARKVFPEWGGWTIVTGAYESDIVSIKDGLTKATAEIFNDKVYESIVTATVLLIVSLLVVWWAINTIVKGLIELKARIDTLSTGEADLTSRIEITSNDEVGRYRKLG